MKLKLIKAKKKYKNIITNTVTYWSKYNIENNSNSSPRAIFNADISNFSQYKKELDNSINITSET